MGNEQDALDSAHKEGMLEAYDNAIDVAQEMREKGEQDMRSVIARIERLKREAK